MWKIIALLCLVLLMPLMVIKAQDNAAQAPIIALAGNKLYAVSPVDGSATVLVEPPAGQTFFMQEFASVSPDGRHMVYATQTDPENQTSDVVSVFVLDFETGKSDILEPGGGVFDVKPLALHHFRLDYPTWSVDGTRLYYLRSEVDDRSYGKMTGIQLAYYDMLTKQHKLVGRLDPKQSVQGLMAVESGIVVHGFSGLGEEQPVTLYSFDNRKMHKELITNLYPFPVRFEGQDYYATGQPNGGIADILNVETGDRQFLGDGYYPALSSRLAKDQSLLLVQKIGSGASYRVFGHDHKRTSKVIVNTYGVRFAIAPDGQSIAYLKFYESQKAVIRIINSDGTERVLTFVAEEILWGASEYVVLYEEAQG